LWRYERFEQVRWYYDHSVRGVRHIWIFFGIVNSDPDSYAYSDSDPHTDTGASTNAHAYSGTEPNAGTGSFRRGSHRQHSEAGRLANVWRMRERRRYRTRTVI
jgi:hypothetical protein